MNKLTPNDVCEANMLTMQNPEAVQALAEFTATIAPHTNVLERNGCRRINIDPSSDEAVSVNESILRDRAFRGGIDTTGRSVRLSYFVHALPHSQQCEWKHPDQFTLTEETGMASVANGQIATMTKTEGFVIVVNPRDYHISFSTRTQKETRRYEASEQDWPFWQMSLNSDVFDRNVSILDLEKFLNRALKTLRSRS